MDLQRRFDIRSCKVVAFEQERLSAILSQSVRDAVDYVQLRRVASALAESAERCECLIRHAVIERNDDYTCILKQLFKRADGSPPLRQ